MHDDAVTGMIKEGKSEMKEKMTKKMQEDAERDRLHAQQHMTTMHETRARAIHPPWQRHQDS